MFSKDDCTDCNKKVNNFRNYTNGTYSGCVDSSDIPNGKGIQYRDGKIWLEGCFKNGKLNGVGKYFYDEKVIREGYFIENMLNGQGTFHPTNGYKAIGNFINDTLREGELYDNKGKLYEKGIFINYKLNGKGTKYFAEYYTEGNFENSEKINGTFTSYSNDGKFKSKETYVQGKLVEYVDNYHSRYKKDDIISEKNKIEIKLNQNPETLCMYLDVKIDGKKEIFLFDTGASGNKLSKDILKKIQSKNLVEKLNVADKEIIIGNGEKVTGNYYMVKELQFDHVKIKNIVFFVFENENSTNVENGIIGMDFISNKFSSFVIKNNKMILEK